MILNNRWSNFEFFPFYIFYFPAYFYWMYLAIRARKFNYFTTLNSIMNNSDAFNSKFRSSLIYPNFLKVGFQNLLKQIQIPVV